MKIEMKKLQTLRVRKGIPYSKIRNSFIAAKVTVPAQSTISNKFNGTNKAPFTKEQLLVILNLFQLTTDESEYLGLVVDKTPKEPTYTRNEVIDIVREVIRLFHEEQKMIGKIRCHLSVNKYSCAAAINGRGINF